MYHLLDNPSEPVNDCSYFECLEVVTEKSRVYKATVIPNMIFKLEIV